MEASPTLDQLRVFLTVVEEGSFSAASRKLNRAQSVISYTIANLESQLEVQLFERSGTRQPRLTDAGSALIDDARRMMAGLHLLRVRARGMAQGVEGQVAVAMDVMVPMPVLTVVLKAFSIAFPAVGIRLHTGALGLVEDLVLKREVGLGIALGAAVNDDDLVRHKIGQQKVVPVAAPQHLLAQASEPVPASIVREHFQIAITDLTEHTLGQDFHVLAFNTWRVTDVTAKLALILEGLGWGGLPIWLVEDHIRDGRLVELQLEPYPPVTYALNAVRLADVPCGPATAWLIDRFEQELKDLGLQ